ncbi:MAG: hypothetical protein PVI90_00455 [Desulfobacteraceae bacterium]|jgi:hypothetical protein
MAKKEILKQELAWWDKDSIVEIWVLTPPGDPNMYLAKCLTSGTFPTLVVLNPRYPKPLNKGEYVIWGVQKDVDSTDAIEDELDTDDISFIIW